MSKGPERLAANSWSSQIEPRKASKVDPKHYKPLEKEGVPTSRYLEQGQGTFLEAHRKSLGKAAPGVEILRAPVKARALQQQTSADTQSHGTDVDASGKASARSLVCLCVFTYMHDRVE